MKTMLKTHTGAPGDGTFSIGNISSLYQAFDSRVGVVENIAPGSRQLSPAEHPGSEEERMSFIHQYAFALLDEDEDLDDEDEPVEDLNTLEETELDETEEEVEEDELDDDLALELDEDDEDEEVI